MRLTDEKNSKLNPLPVNYHKVDELIYGKKDLEEVLLFKSTTTLELDDEASVTAVSSQKSHKIEVGSRKGAASICFG